MAKDFLNDVEGNLGINGNRGHSLLIFFVTHQVELFVSRRGHVGIVPTLAPVHPVSSRPQPVSQAFERDRKRPPSTALLCH